ncbi:putative methyltransferase-domain-containing protein [Russula compacta]|nr:putative methyltransferase-domain-containing protein [Russula compacta]
MFFYISFLRTPPHSMSNDLRTEPFPTSVDIFYWWISSESASCTGPRTAQTVARLSEPAKLTTWRQENAYKVLQIPPPLPLKKKSPTGFDCALVLCVAPIVTCSIVDLRDPEIGRVPLPVCSLPIRISPEPLSRLGRGRGGDAGSARVVTSATTSTATGVTKQEAITRSFRLFDGDAAPLMWIKETVSFDLDKKLWDSGIGLSAWLEDVSASVASQQQQPAIVRELEEKLFGREECRIIELGAGTGIVSLVLAALRSAHLITSSPHHEDCILSTDLPSSMELMSYNIRMNAAHYPRCPPTALPLDWDEELLPEPVQVVLERGGFDLVVMADVTYNTSSFPALLRTLASLLAPSTGTPPHPPRNDDDVGSSGPLVVLAYKERDPAERQLWDMVVRETGVVLECVGKQAGAGGLPIEIWLGKKRR